LPTPSSRSRLPLAAAGGLAATFAAAVPATAQIQWLEHDQLGPRLNAAAAFDSVRDRLVLVGGTRGSMPTDGTW
jgi:hypothetical protein